jgi:hypothetical protein
MNRLAIAPFALLASGIIAFLFCLNLLLLTLMLRGLA